MNSFMNYCYAPPVYAQSVFWILHIHSARLSYIGSWCVCAFVRARVCVCLYIYIEQKQREVSSVFVYCLFRMLSPNKEFSGISLENSPMIHRVTTATWAFWEAGWSVYAQFSLFFPSFFLHLSCISSLSLLRQKKMLAITDDRVIEMSIW